MKFIRNICIALALIVGIGAAGSPALATQVLLNNTYSKLTAAVAPSDVTITVTAGDGVKFASATGGNTITATLVKISGFREIAWEIVTVTARSTDTLTITRARESTTALSFAVGDLIDVRITAGLTPGAIGAAALAGSASQAFAAAALTATSAAISGATAVSGSSKTTLTLYSDANARIYSTDSMAIDKGGSLALGGSYTGTSYLGFASLRGAKENSSDNNADGYLAFYTARNGVGTVEGFRLQSTGHLKSQGTAPALTSCGSSPAITGSDTAGTVTMGTAAPTGCVITFNIAYASTAPHCVVTWQTNIASMQYTVSTTAITLVQTGTSSNKVNYVCFSST